MAKEGLTQTIVKVPTEDYRTFRRYHSGQGAWTQFVRECLRLYNELCQDDPEEIMEEVIATVKEEMRDE